MSDMTGNRPPDHDAPAEVFRTAPPLVEVPEAPRRTPAEEARALMTLGTIGTLGTLSEDGGPWASVVGFVVLEDGSPVLLVSTLAEHGRNLARDPRASLSFGEPPPAGVDPLDSGRVSLAGTAVQPEGEEADRALAAYQEAFPAARLYAGFGDFTLWMLRVERVRWVGGFGRMDSVTPESYAAAEPDPTAPAAKRAVEHLNEDHADALLEIAQALAGYPDATSAHCRRIDRYGLDLWIRTPRGDAPARVGFAEPCTAPDGLRSASVELVRRARAADPEPAV